MGDGAPELSLQEAARLVGGRVVGDGTRRVARIAALEDAGPDDLSLLASPRYRSEAERSSAPALLVREGLEIAGRDQIVVADPHLALTALLPRLHSGPPVPAGISSDARIAPDARIGAGAAVGPFAVIEAGCRIGDRTRIGAGCFIGAGSEVGEGSVLHPRTVVYHGCRLGKNVIVHSGTVIGSDGFGYATAGGVHTKVPQVGGVLIEDDVEIGASVTIDRGSIGTTVVGRGTKIDNLVQIGHNVRIGPHCLIVAQVGISGSTRIGAGSVFAGQSGAAGHLTIGAGAVVASKSAVYEDLPAGARVAGIPAFEIGLWRRAQAVFKRLPGLRAELRRAVQGSGLREKLGEGQGDSLEPPRKGGQPVGGTRGAAEGRRAATRRRAPDKKEQRHARKGRQVNGKRAAAGKQGAPGARKGSAAKKGAATAGKGRRTARKGNDSR